MNDCKASCLPWPGLFKAQQVAFALMGWQRVRRGLATGGLSSVLRIFGKEKGIPLLADSTVAVTMAGALIDCGVVLRAYSRGELSGEETVAELQNTATLCTA